MKILFLISDPLFKFSQNCSNKSCRFSRTVPKNKVKEVRLIFLYKCPQLKVSSRRQKYQISQISIGFQHRETLRLFQAVDKSLPVFQMDKMILIFDSGIISALQTIFSEVLTRHYSKCFVVNVSFRGPQVPQFRYGVDMAFKGFENLHEIYIINTQIA